MKRYIMVTDKGYHTAHMLEYEMNTHEKMGYVFVPGSYSSELVLGEMCYSVMMEHMPSEDGDGDIEESEEYDKRFIVKEDEEIESYFEYEDGASSKPHPDPISRPVLSGPPDPKDFHTDPNVLLPDLKCRTSTCVMYGKILTRGQYHLAGRATVSRAQKYACKECGRSWNMIVDTVFNNKKKPPSTILECFKRVAEGDTFTRICEDYGLSSPMVTYWLRQARTMSPVYIEELLRYYYGMNRNKCKVMWNRVSIQRPRKR